MSIFDSLAKFFFGVRRDLELPEEIWAEIFRLVCCVSELDDAPRLLSFPTADSQKLLATRMVRLTHCQLSVQVLNYQLKESTKRYPGL
jgi:hypothetical protein